MFCPMKTRRRTFTFGVLEELECVDMNTGREFEDAYKATDFVVEDGFVEFAIRIGQKNAKLDNFLADRKIEMWAFITAFNPRSKQLSDEENATRHDELLALVKSRGFESLVGYGRACAGDWPPERSLFVLNIDRDSAGEIGRRFGQNAVVAGRFGEDAELVWCDWTVQ